MLNTQAKKQKLEDENGKKGEQFSFSSPWHFSDVILAVEGHKFHVHKSTLSMWSKVFERMFTSDFKEKSAPEIPLPGKKAREIEVLLKMIYEKEESVSDHNLEILLKFADEYQMEKLTKLCTDFMMNTLLKRETAMHVYVMARRYNLTSIFKNPCLEHLKYWQLILMKNNGHYSELSVEEQLEMVCYRTEALENELGYTKSNQKFNCDLDKSKMVKSCKLCNSSPCNRYSALYDR